MKLFLFMCRRPQRVDVSHIRRDDWITSYQLSLVQFFCVLFCFGFLLWGSLFELIQWRRVVAAASLYQCVRARVCVSQNSIRFSHSVQQQKALRLRFTLKRTLLLKFKWWLIGIWCRSWFRDFYEAFFPGCSLGLRARSFISVTCPPTCVRQRHHQGAITRRFFFPAGSSSLLQSAELRRPARIIRTTSREKMPSGAQMKPTVFCFVFFFLLCCRRLAVQNYITMSYYKDISLSKYFFLFFVSISDTFFSHFTCLKYSSFLVASLDSRDCWLLTKSFRC